MSAKCSLTSKEDMEMTEQEKFYKLARQVIVVVFFGFAGGVLLTLAFVIYLLFT